jgi:hypothetical protein
MDTLATHGRPVNLQAAKIFWKAPWWAKLPIEDKEEIVRTEVKLEDLVDVFSAPPLLPGSAHNQIKDWRGWKVKHKGLGIVALVLGYAYAGRGSLRARKTVTSRFWNGSTWSSAKMDLLSSRGRAHRWYAFFQGEVNIIEVQNWSAVGNYEPITKPGEINAPK